MRRNKEQLHELINHYHFHNNKYSLIYQGVQSQRSRSCKELLILSVHTTANMQFTYNSF